MTRWQYTRWAVGFKLASWGLRLLRDVTGYEAAFAGLGFMADKASKAMGRDNLHKWG